jgi:DNA invertase Pin-like site-specific DNA recombinase
MSGLRDISSDMPKDDNKKSQTLIHAAMFIRMSTFHQKSTTDEHADVIREYAKKQEFEIVQTYVDDRMKGHNVAGYDALKKMLNDMASGNATYKVILAHDISCWGLGYNHDQSSHYECICKQAGIRVEYCDEMYSQNGSFSSLIIQSIKRGLAQEYAREMAEKYISGEGFYLESDQLQTLREKLANVTTTIHLVAKPAWKEKDRADLNDSIRIAKGSLVEINKMIEENIHSDHSTMDSHSTEENLG